MEKAAGGEVTAPKRGPKPQPRKKLLISMTAADYEEFDAWANEEGVTKATLMRDMMGRERERREQLRKGA